MTESLLEKRVYSFVFWTLCLLSILPVWYFANFITADGPCHVYNAAVLKSFWTGDTAFYQQFYSLNTDLEPNWFSHAFLSLLLFIVKPAIAEKVIITVCLLFLATGFRYFITGFSARQSGMALWIFLFIWQLAMFMGFYNYMLSMGGMFWISGYWLRHKGQLSVSQIICLALACVVLYFMHLLGLFLLAAIMGLSALSGMAGADNNKKKQFGRQALQIVYVLLPAGILTLSYIARNTNSFSNEWKGSYTELWNNLKGIFSIQSIAAYEYHYTVIIADVIAVFFVTAIVLVILKKARSTEWITPLVLTIILLLAYFFAYESMLGGSFIRYRLESLIYLFAISFIASVPVNRVVRIAHACFVVVMFGLFMYHRLPAFADSSRMVGEFKSLSASIEDNSVVLQLKYDPFPKNAKGETIANKVGLFSHVAEVLHEPGKHLIFCDNYEANTGYFPLLWKEHVNPFTHLAKGPGIEAAPPQADITGYNKSIAPIKYIIVFAKQGDILNDPATKAMADTINTYYDLVKVTPEYKIELYRLK